MHTLKWDIHLNYRIQYFINSVSNTSPITKPPSKELILQQLPERCLTLSQSKLKYTKGLITGVVLS